MNILEMNQEKKFYRKQGGPTHMLMMKQGLPVSWSCMRQDEHHRILMNHHWQVYGITTLVVVMK